MKEAYGGIVNLVFISIFLVIISGVLGLIVSYTKAFKMKNVVISTIEEYEGSGCMEDTTACFSKIKEGAASLAYVSNNNLSCSNGYTNIDGYYCIKKTMVKSATSTNRAIYVYSVVTQVNISFPLVDKIMGFSIFQVSGDTHEVESPV